MPHDPGFRLVMDLVPVLIWCADRDNRLVFFNKAWSEFTGSDPNQRSRRRWHAVLHPDEAEATVASIDTHLRQRERFRVELQLKRRDGAWRWMTCSGVPRIGADGVFAGFVGSCTDVTELKEAEAQRKRDTDEKQAVMQELHHRVKNNAQVFASLLGVQASRAPDPAVKAALRVAAARAATMAFAQQQIWDAGSSARFDVVALVRRLARAILAHDVEIAVEAPARLDVPLATAVPLGLIVHELLTNAVMHGYPDGGPGLVRVALEQSDGRFTLCVVDYGIGFPVGLDLAALPSAGLTIVRSLVRQLGASLSFGAEWSRDASGITREGGTAITVRFNGAV